MKKTILSLVAMLAISATTLSASDSYATVNGEAITKTDIISLIRNPKVNFATLPKEQKEQVINQLIEKKLLMQKAEQSGVQDEAKFKQALAKIKKDLALEIWMQKEFAKIKITEADKKSFYDKNKAKFQTPVMLEARHILVPTQKEASDIISKLNKAKNKKGSFEELAKKFSTGPSKDKGGYLGKFQAKQMVPEFSKAATALKKGEYTKTPVKTQFGFHVIYLENKEAAKALAYEKVKAKIEKSITQDVYTKFIKEEVAKLRKDAKIIIK